MDKTNFVIVSWGKEGNACGALHTQNNKGFRGGRAAKGHWYGTHCGNRAEVIAMSSAEASNSSRWGHPSTMRFWREVIVTGDYGRVEVRGIRGYQNSRKDISVWLCECASSDEAPSHLVMGG
jgi:hypothetical protein